MKHKVAVVYILYLHFIQPLLFNNFVTREDVKKNVNIWLQWFETIIKDRDVLIVILRKLTIG